MIKHNKLIGIAWAPEGWLQDRDFVFCGRDYEKNGYNLPKSPFHNPFPLKEGAEKGSTLPSFEQYLEHKIKEDLAFRTSVRDLWGKTLVCPGNCRPENCHCSVIAKIVDRLNAPWNVDKRIVAATGHRPDKIFHNDPYGEENRLKLVNFATRCVEYLKPDMMIVGMAIGWDQAVAEACIATKTPFIAAIPCLQHTSKWGNNKALLARYKTYMSKALAAEIVTPALYTNSCMQVRNVWMANRSTETLALYDGSSGGTGNYINYALRQEQRIINVWEAWDKER